MSKSLFVCRHAATAPAVAGQSDFDRPLTSQGLLEAQQAAAWIGNTGLSISAICCSAAVRTQATGHIFSELLHQPAEALHPAESLYLASAIQWENTIERFPSSWQVAVIIGHNPAISTLVGKFNSRPGQYVPTGGVNLFTFATDDWRELCFSDPNWEFNY